MSFSSTWKIKQSKKSIAINNSCSCYYFWALKPGIWRKTKCIRIYGKVCVNKKFIASWAWLKQQYRKKKKHSLRNLIVHDTKIPIWSQSIGGHCIEQKKSNEKKNNRVNSMSGMMWCDVALQWRVTNWSNNAKRHCNVVLIWTSSEPFRNNFDSRYYSVAINRHIFTLIIYNSG